MAWKDARTEIKALLETVSIAEPIKEAIARVYEFPPPTVEDLPCFIIGLPALKIERGPSLRIRTYKVRLTLLVRDADVDRAAEIADAYREAILDVFDADVTLGGNCTQALAPEFEEGSGFEYPGGSGKHYVGYDIFLTVEIKEAKAFS